MPERPVVEIGMIDWPTEEILAGLSDGSDPIHHAPLSTYDKATCFKSDEWEKELVYIELLEQFANQCKKAAEGMKP